MPVSISGAGSISGLDQGFNVTTGSVGVGTTNPRTDLQVGAFGGGDSNIQLATGTSGASNILFGDGSAGSDYYKGFIKYNHSTDNLELYTTDDLIHYTGGTERLRITSDGKMGLGTQTPADKLSISGGSLGIYNTGNSHGNVYFYKDGTPKGWLKYRGDNDTLLIGNVTDSIHVLSSGNVAIGHNSAPTKLGIRGTSASTDATVQIVGNGVSTLLLGQDAAGGVIRGQGGSNQLKFKVGGSGDDAAATGGVEALRIDSSGRLMLGQTSAYSATGTGTMMLTVTKNASNRTDVAISNQFSGDNASAAFVLATHGQDYILEATGSGNTTDGIRAFRILKGSDERLRIDSDGKMGINTNAPSARVDINHPHTEQGLIVRSRYGNINTAMVKFDADPDSDGGDGNVVHIHGGSSRTDSEILHVNSTGEGTCFQIRGDGRTRVYKQLELEHSSNVAKIIFNEYGANDTKAQIEMDQVSGSAGQLIFRTQHGGTLSERMRISSAGFVTTPNQPCFCATSNTGGSDTSNGYTGIISNQFEAAYVNVGNHYNTSTGVFTCPVAGTYEFHGQGLIRHQTGVGRAELSFYKNGSNTISRSYGYTYITGASDHDNLHVMGYITCAANDQIDLRVVACDSGIDVYWAQGLGYFAGRLVQ